MADDDDRRMLAGMPRLLRRDLRDDARPGGVADDLRLDAGGLQLPVQPVHAEREDAEKAAHQIDARRLGRLHDGRLPGGRLLRLRLRLGFGRIGGGSRDRWRGFGRGRRRGRRGLRLRSLHGRNGEKHQRGADEQKGGKPREVHHCSVPSSATVIRFTIAKAAATAKRGLPPPRFSRSSRTAP